MQNNQDKFLEFRDKFDYLCYQKHEITEEEKGLRVRYFFDLSGKVQFTPSFLIPPQDFEFKIDKKSAAFEKIVFHIGLLELVSYWKAACPKKIIIAAYRLDDFQKKWLKKVYFKGLSEFFYLNNIDTNQEDFVTIISEGEKPMPSADYSYLLKEEINLIPVGGGKDSAVTADILARQQQQTICFLLNPRPSCEKVSALAGHPTFEIRRYLDKGLLELNAQGYLNGHTPFSALLSFYSLLVSALLGARHIVLSNESSANEATIPGTEVNHQYSKTVEYESDFRNYTKRYFSEAFNYFSFLRPINELQIAGMLARFEKYLPIFRSCNKGSKTDSWCAKCSKCLFTYIMLAPFLPTEKLVEIYGANLLDDRDLERLFWQLTGHADEKPFECVGTIEEVNAGVQMIAKRLLKSNLEKDLPYLLKEYLKKNSKPVTKGLLSEFVSTHFLSPSFEKLLQHEIKNIQPLL